MANSRFGEYILGRIQRRPELYTKWKNMGEYENAFSAEMVVGDMIIDITFFHKRCTAEIVGHDEFVHIRI